MFISYSENYYLSWTFFYRFSVIIAGFAEDSKAFYYFNVKLVRVLFYFTIRVIRVNVREKKNIEGQGAIEAFKA